ncbi:MAG TPA: diguanylate cyclase [Geminicoccaceae bacterium]|nr:diguanylate cyclase [Geminicoccaceae bacterium]
MSGAIRVLLIEDSPSDARVAARLLGEGEGFEVTHVDRLSEATARLGRGGFDAVLLDPMLPDSSGLATVSSVHERAPDLPIIVYGGRDAEDVLFACEAVRGGAQDLLPKSPASPTAMRRAIVTSIERKRLELFRIRHARHDPLTGLANRLLLAERFERAVARAERQGKSLGLIAIEPDRCPRAVEQAGGAFGDDLLRALAERLKANIRRSDTLARVRERGFIALLEGLCGDDVADALANKLLRLMTPPFRIDGQEISLTASVGIALFPTHGHGLQELMELAESAMLDVALAGGNGCRVADAPPGPMAPAVSGHLPVAHAPGGGIARPGAQEVA